MARVTEDWKAREYGRRTAKRSWIVSDVDNERQALEAVGAPAQHNAGHFLLDALKCEGDGVSVTREDFTVFRVTVPYSIPADGSEEHPDTVGTGEGGDPLFLPAEFEWQDGSASEEWEYAFDKDDDSKLVPIANSAKDVYSPGEPVEIPMGLYIVTVNLPVFDAAWATGLKNKLSDGDFVTKFGTFTGGEVLCRGGFLVGAVTKHHTVYRTRFVFEIRPRALYPDLPANATPFDTKRIDQGVNSWYDVSGALTKGRIHHRTDGLVSADVRLNGKGSPIEHNSFKVTRANKTAKDIGEPNGVIVHVTDDGVVLYFRRHKKMDFSGLPIYDFQ